ncbi:VOC family protein [Gordonia sp. CPCC 205515]|uniref:VOC family protein n=1 Tax=Gordonia sp. CPCC 205515 TaxID=3140791 RepID=UPI003AF35869
MSGRLNPRGVLIDLVTPDPDRTDSAYRRLLGLDDDSPLAVTNGYLRPGAGTRSHTVLFGVDDLSSAERLLTRRGLSPDEPFGVTDAPPSSGQATGPEVPAPEITALDHLVISAPSRDHALALFGATLDLDFRLDQEIGGGVRQLFFRSADVVVEVITGGEPSTADADTCTLWGLAWRSTDIDATHRRLEGAGVDVSELRIGRKRGTRIFTVRDADLATRTAVISQAE